MLILNPYTYDERFTLEADLSLKGAGLILEYALYDRAGVFDLPLSSGLWSAEQIARSQGLWEATCFEAFLQPVGFEKYYEFNFSLKPAWNGFQFEAYRQPQPLVETADFAVQSMEWVAAQNRLVVVVENLSGYRKFKVGLAAVLQERSKNIHYCSIAHRGIKPDFHLADNFTLVRGV